MHRIPRTSSARVAHRSFWILVLVAVLAAGSLNTALAASPGRIAGISVLVSGSTLALSVALAVRVLAALDRARRQVRTLSE